jgi:hypothetical protein
MDHEAEVQAAVDRARVLGLDLHVADLWRLPSGVLTVRGGVEVRDWLDAVAAEDR